MKTNMLMGVLFFTASSAYASCGSSFCSVNTHWDTQGLVNEDTLRFDLRYSYAKTDTLRGGSSKITPEDPSGSDEEIEKLRIVNQLLNLNLDYAVGPKWNIAVDLPFVMRDHSHMFDSLLPDAPFVQQAKFN
jgi:hypothetical protein